MPISLTSRPLHRHGYKLQSQNRKTHSPFPFMKLPPEVRRMVYKAALQPGGPFGVAFFAPGESGGHPTALFRVSKTIRAEFSDVFYGTYDFVLRDIYQLLIWLVLIGQQNQAYLRSLEIAGYGESSEIWSTVTGNPPGHETADQISYRGWTRSVAELLQDCPRLERLQMNYLYCYYSLPPLRQPHPPHGPHVPPEDGEESVPPKDWEESVWHAVEIIHDDFRAFLDKRLNGGDAPRKLSRVLRVGWANYVLMTPMWEDDPAFPAFELEANESAAEHMRLMLEGDVGMLEPAVTETGL